MAALPLREDNVGWYLYGVVADGAEAPAAAPVDPRHEVVALAEGAVAGIASRVSLDEFDEAALPERLADAAWLEEKIRAHEQVLEEALARGAVVPCRFCTVYRDEQELRRFLAGHAEALAAALAQFEGRVELGVKAFAARAGHGGQAAQAQSGRAYLEVRRREQQAREELARSRADVAARLHERLLAAADNGVLLDLQSRDVSGRDAEMVFNGAYLVSDGGRFREALGHAARESDGLELELTGPWPPYNFVPEELGLA
jgi:gas vesicle protein GvpL/GvpF